MAAKIRRMLRLYALYARLDLSWFLRDTRYCLLNILSDLLGNAVGAFFTVFALARRLGGVGGMDQTQVLFMLGYSLCINGVFEMFLGMNNVGFISRRIGRGQVDHMLIQPLPLWVQLATEGFIPVSGNTSMLCGIALLIYAAGALGISVTLGGVLLTAACVAASSCVILACSYIIGCAAFRAPVAAEEISSTVVGTFSNFKSFPLGGLAQGAQLLAVTAFPIGLIAWFPSCMLLGLPAAGLPMAFHFAFAFALMAVAAYTFKRGLRHYAKYGSQRYSRGGHRS